MNPIKIDIIEKKSRIILDELEVLAEIESRRDSLTNDPILEHALAHAMQNCIAAVIDIAQHICAEKLESPPESYSDAIAALGPLGVLDSQFAEEFSRVAKLRNVLVHLYDNVDYRFLFSLVPSLRQDTKMFLKHISDYLW